MARGKFDPNRNEPTPAFPNGRRILSKEEEAHELTPLQDIAREWHPSNFITISFRKDFAVQYYSKLFESVILQDFTF